MTRGTALLVGFATATALAGMSRPVAGVAPGRAPEQTPASDSVRAAVTTVAAADFRPDADAVSARLTADLAWQRAALAGAYARYGNRDPRWDLAATTGLDFLARERAHDPARPGDSHDQAWHWLRHAVDLGSDDPLVELLATQLSKGDVKQSSIAGRLTSAATALEQSEYPPYWRSIALAWAADAVAGRHSFPHDDWRRANAMLDRSASIVPEVAADTAMPDVVLLEFADTLATSFARIGRDPHIPQELILAAVTKQRGERHGVLPLLRASFLLREADAADAAIERDARLSEAAASVAHALQLGSTSPAIPALMIGLAVAERAESQQFDGWFRHAVAVEPGARWPYERKLAWLMARSPHDALAFARALSGADAPLSRVSLLVAAAHRGALDAPACGEILPAYERFLSAYPDAVSEHGAYARTLSECGRWQDAHAALEALTPERARASVFGGPADYDRLRYKAAVRARIAE
jgi:hypothetical protein